MPSTWSEPLSPDATNVRPAGALDDVLALAT